MFTPQTPRLTIITAVTLLMLVCCHSGKAQNTRLKALPDYEASLKAYHTGKMIVQTEEYKQLIKRKWWYYLPTLGLNFGLPSLNGGSNQLVQLDVQKQQNKARLQSIISQATLDYQTDLHQLRAMYATIIIEQESLADIPVTQKMESNIFAVSEEANRQKQIKPVEYQQAMLSYQRQYLAHDQEKRNYQLKIISLEQFARYQFPAEVLVSVPDSVALKQTVSGGFLTRRKN